MMQCQNLYKSSSKQTIQTICILIHMIPFNFVLIIKKSDALHEHILHKIGVLFGLNSKKAICTTGWENGNAKSIFEIFSPTSPNGIYSYYNIKDIPFYHSPTDAYVTIIKGHELIIVFAEQNILITGSSRNIWTKKWHSINLSILS